MTFIYTDRFNDCLFIKHYLFNILYWHIEFKVPFRLFGLTIKYPQYISVFILIFIKCRNLNIVKIKPLRGAALFVMNPTLVYAIVENYFGGSGKYHTRIEGRDFTHTEMQVVMSILRKIFEDLRKAWEPIMDLEFEHVNSEVNPYFANIASPSEVIIVSSFHVEIDKTGGHIHLALPYSMIEPIRDQLHAGLQSDINEHDEYWEKMMFEGIKQSSLTVKCPLTRFELTLRDLKKMKPGDVIPIDMSETVTGFIEGVPVFKGKYGLSRGNHAVKITSMNNPNKRSATAS